MLFTGDFVFVGAVGRPDLLGAEQQKELAHQLYHSVFHTLKDVPDFTEIFPAHGAGSLCGKAIGSRRSSTLGFERRFNRSLQPADESTWTATLLSDMPLAPPYFRRMKQVNAQGPAVLGLDMPGNKRFSAKEVQQRLCEHCMIVDVRPKEAFAAAHIPGSINIPLGANLPSWAGWVLPYEKHLLIVPDDPDDMSEVVTHLIRVGLDQIGGYLEDGVEAWQNHGFPIASLDTISVHDLAASLKAPSSQRPFVLDVRTNSEWSNGHIDGAVHIHGGLLKDRYREIPQDRPIAVICGTGYRGSIAASFLKSHGYQEVGNVAGGMSAWTGAGLPVAK
jgi:hydroxyacylglutathione hydrolase